MQWSDDGIVLGVRRHGEANAILELMTRAHGRHLGLVRGGAGSRLRPVLQPGNSRARHWRARLDEHLGYLHGRGPQAAGGILPQRALRRLCGDASRGFGPAAAGTRPARERLRPARSRCSNSSTRRRGVAADVVRFELQMLSELGFGLDLSSCAATGEIGDLVYVSPKSGRAVSRGGGEAWQDKLLRLPAFLNEDGDAHASAEDITQGFALTGFFLSRYVLEPRGVALTDARAHFIAAIARALPSAA